LIRRLKKVIGSYWARSKAFRIIIIATFSLFMAVPIFLLIVYARTLLGPSVITLFFIAILVFGYVTRKKGYVEKVKERSPKHYYKYYRSARRVQFIVGGGLLTAFAILTTLRVLLGRPLPYPQGVLLFIILMVLGACVSDLVGRKLKQY
jgi:uncharacterized membrane protein YbhN (UPF0104 family)